MWDAKRQFIWLVAGLTLGLSSLTQMLTTKTGHSFRFFVFMESLVLVIIALLFYLYCEKNNEEKQTAGEVVLI